MSTASLTDKLDAMLAELRSLDDQLADPATASNPDQIMQIGMRRAALDPICSQYEAYRQKITEIEELRELASDDDTEIREMAKSELPDAQRLAEEIMSKLKGDLVTADDRSIGSVILEIRAGVGGAEAAIFAGDLLEMYHRYVMDKGWKWEPMSFSPAEQGGFKQVIVNVKGESVWLHLGYEGGSHCVKRVPVTESQGRIHTSTATVAVLPEPETVEINIPESDVKIDITTSQGPGGQNVNKVATAVKMVHLPTGIEVRMQDTKSQHQNREKAWQLMRARVYEHYQHEKDAERAETRSEMIGTGERSERIRTYRFKDNLCVDQRIGQSFNLQEIMVGHLDGMVNSLIEHDKAQRLAAL